MGLSLCMIVRDEGEHLGRCLSSVRDVVDEVCVVDTGSTDDTVAIARFFGAQVETLAWSDDFAAARNASLALAKEDWILVLDADEEVVTNDARSKLLDFSRRTSVEAGRIWIQDEEEQGACPVTRFFPRGARPCFRGRIHEQLLLAGRAPRTADTGIEVLHTGYGGASEARHRKLMRNADLLLGVLAEQDDPYYHYQLGRTWFVGGDHDRALEAFTSALDQVEPEAPYLAHLIESTAYSLRSLERSEEAFELVRKVAPAFRDRADTCFVGALLAMDTGELVQAEDGFRHCLTLAGTRPEGGPYSRVAQTLGPAHNLGVMYEVLGLKDAAEEAYRRALEFDPAHAASLEGLARCTGR